MAVDEQSFIAEQFGQGVFDPQVTADFPQPAAEGGDDLEAQDALATERSGYLALIAVDSEAESPVAATAEPVSTGEPHTGDANVAYLSDYRRQQAAQANGATSTMLLPSDRTQVTGENERWVRRSVAVLQSKDARKQDRHDAFAVLATAYSPRLASFIGHMVGSKELAEDVLQDTLLAASRSIGRFEYRGEGALRSWFYNIARNRSLNVIRTAPYQASRTNASFEDYMVTVSGFSAVEQNSNPDTAIEQMERLATLQGILESLLPHEREAIILQANGQSYEQIAATLDRTVASVKSILIRGRQKVRKGMRAYETGIDEDESDAGHETEPDNV